MKKLLITLTVLIAYACLANAQLPVYEHLNNAEYIFEGQIIKIEAFTHPKDYTLVYTSNLIKINRVFKGDLKPGEIVDLTTLGGIVFDENGEEIGSSSYIEARYEVSTKATFFCSSGKGYVLENSKTIQYKRLRRLGNIGYDMGWQEEGAISTKYTSRKNFYNYLQKNYKGVVIPVQGFDPEFDKNIFENIKIDRTTKFTDSSQVFRPDKNFYNYKADSTIRAQREMIKKKSLSFLKSASMGNNNILYSFINQKFTADNTTDRFFEFDIAIQAVNNNTYLDNTIVRFKFNNNAFGNTPSYQKTLGSAFGSSYSYFMQGYETNP